MNHITNNLKHIKEQIELKTTHPVTLIAVSKNFSLEDIVIAYQSCQNNFGENYTQELESKAKELQNLPICWHFIGNIQSNKTKLIATYASWVHTLTKKEHAKRLNAQRSLDKDQLQVLIEVNISNESTKHGLKTLNEIIELASEINQMPRLKLRGLMGMAGNHNNAELIKQDFLLLSNYLNQLQKFGFDVDQLSMGMSNDYQIALSSGATMLRIGTQIFGARK